MIQNKTLNSIRDLVIGNLTTDDYIKEDTVEKVTEVLVNTVDTGNYAADNNQILHKNDDYLYVYAEKEVSPTRTELQILTLDINTFDIVNTYIIDYHDPQNQEWSSMLSFDVDPTGTYIWMVNKSIFSTGSNLRIRRYNTLTRYNDIYYDITNPNSLSTQNYFFEKIKAVKENVIYLASVQNNQTNRNTSITRYDFQSETPTTTNFDYIEFSDFGIDNINFDVSERIITSDEGDTIESEMRALIVSSGNGSVRVNAYKKPFTGTLFNSIMSGSIPSEFNNDFVSQVDTLHFFNDTEIFFKGEYENNYALYKYSANDGWWNELLAQDVILVSNQRNIKSFTSQNGNLILFPGTYNNAGNIEPHIIWFENRNNTLQETQVINASPWFNKSNYFLFINNSDINMYLNNGGTDNIRTQNWKIDVVMSIGSDTIENLKITEHALGISDNSLNPDDIRLTDEVIRKQITSKVLTKNLFTSYSNLTTTEGNGYTFKEIGIQTENNSMVGRYITNKFKDEKVQMTIQNQLKHNDPTQVETPYMEEELAKFHDGSGVPANVKITKIQFWLDGKLVVQLAAPIVTILENPGEALYSLQYLNNIDGNTRSFNEVVALNAADEILQYKKLTDIRTLKPDTLYKAQMVLRVKEIGAVI